jgi:hypothetical protein
VFAFLSYDEFGGAPYSPLAYPGATVFEEVVLPDGRTAVVDGLGRPVFHGESKSPVFGEVLPSMLNRVVLDPPRDEIIAANDLLSAEAPNAWQGGHTPQGPWTGAVRLDAEHGNGVATGMCVATLTGTVTNNSVSATGRCNADHAGLVNVTLSGSLSNGFWSGSITASPEIDPTHSRVMNWLAPADRNDAFWAASEATFSESPGTVNADATLYMKYAGERRLSTAAEFFSLATARAVLHSATAGFGASLPMSTAACSQVVNAAPILEASNE